jgi:hypothetical protein
MDACIRNQSQSGTEFHVPCSTLLAYRHFRLIGSISSFANDETDCRTVLLPLVSLLHLYRYITIFVSFFLCRSISVSVPFPKENLPLKIERRICFLFFYLFFFCFYYLIVRHRVVWLQREWDQFDAGCSVYIFDGCIDQHSSASPDM